MGIWDLKFQHAINPSMITTTSITIDLGFTDSSNLELMAEVTEVKLSLGSSTTTEAKLSYSGGRRRRR